MDLGLYRAAQEGDLGASKQHIQHFSTDSTPNRNTPLHVVVCFNDTWECTEEILKTNESLLFEVNFEGNSEFHIAARNERSTPGSTMTIWAKRSTEDVELETKMGILHFMMQ
ncbi:Hypothetical predicted protein [Olea europaea subsp. europaea]|uniref:Uncharacterized protein n=1 Tax=Olea europaea subsp. europaea TaxID=158383 RepID=A0A8S0T4S2_OLEEU|nr:Hypothetical predicted protein [Olea europaea subsp. europaea]